jgi:hypothetical protein
MSSPLEKLRAITRNANVPGYEINERNEGSPRQIEPPTPPDRLLSLNSFNSYPETFAKPVEETPEQRSAPSQPDVEPTDDLEERAALIEYGAGVPRRWAEGFAALSSMSPPTGFSPERWCRIIDAAGVFLDRWAVRAAELGWCDVEIFGCDADAPAARLDQMGLVVLLERMHVVAIDETGADLLSNIGDVRQRYRRRPISPHAVRLWDLASGGTASDL